MSTVLKLVVLLVIANVIAWFQIQGQFMKGSIAQLFTKDWVVVMLGIPIGWMFWRSATLSYEYFGAVWNIRMIGFGLGTAIFGVLTWAILDELPGWHTGISLVLAAAIIMLQFANLK